MNTFLSSVLAAGIAVLAAGPALATPTTLTAGSSVNLTNYPTYEVTSPDADWFGTTLWSGTASANRTRDGVLGPGPVIPGLFNVDAFVDATVTSTTNGNLVFGYDLYGTDNSGGGLNGVVNYMLTGFGSYDVTFAWTGGVPTAFYAPTIGRSVDGDTITVSFRDPRDILGAPGVIERFLFMVDAPTYALAGGGTAGIALQTFGTGQEALSGALPSAAAVPLPASVLLLLGGIAGLAALRRRT